jgi:hypothetical protein
VVGVVFAWLVCGGCGERINGWLARQGWYPGPCVGELFEASKASLLRAMQQREAA